MEYLIAFSIALGLNLLLFIPAFLFKTDKLTDLSYALSFIIVSIMLFLNGTGTAAHVMLLSMIILWALRLGGYLFIRIRKIKQDKRFDGMRESFPRFLQFWFFQGVTVFVVLISSIPFFASSNPELTYVSLAGFCIWLFGLLVESVADAQKYRFMNDESNKGKWIDSGLWHYSRHPNYFGEIIVWVGVYLFVLGSFGGGMGIDAFIGLLSPLYIACIIIFVSGIPLLEKGADKMWGGNPAYEAYKKTTSVLLLLPKKRS